MNLQKLLLAATFATTTAIAGIGATSAQADTFTVFTGYADNLRASGFFPSTWIGDSGVVSESSGLQSFDAGAIRIQNTGSTAITVSNFQVAMNGGSGPTYNFWNTLNIGAGQNGIFTQTFSYNFDSSDNSPNGGPYGGLSGSSAGSNGIGGCSSTLAAQIGAGIAAQCALVQPIVSFDIGADHFSFNDSGHILDTGWYDFINGSPDGNESINWNLIGSGANRGGTSVPEPAAWALMIVGFAGMGAALRRRRTAIAA
jgi:hypothetical protein